MLHILENNTSGTQKCKVIKEVRKYKDSGTHSSQRPQKDQSGKILLRIILIRVANEGRLITSDS